MRLAAATQARLPDAVARPSYDRDQAVGIVHFGIGAFHRAHQAWYTDACLNAGEQHWMIAGVSLRSGSVAEQLNPQDGLFTLTESSAKGKATRLIGSLREVLVAGQSHARLIARLTSPQTHIVSFTVTEKGYCRAADGSLDLELAREGSFYPLLTEAMRERHRGGIAGLTLLSCDNLAQNGAQLDRLMREYFAAEAPDLIGWFESECRCPSTMVDRIVPATSPADLDQLEAEIGMRDEGAVFTELFSQWVIEDKFAGPRPRWEDHGAQIVADVAPYETAKLRMLNGAHSLLAYCGLDKGHSFVHEAIADPGLRTLTDRLMREEAAPTIAGGEGQDLAAYADALVRRFANPALNHKLIQIAMDGSQKIPQRWLETLAEHQRRGCQCPAILTGLAAWLRHVRGDIRVVDDPLAGELRKIWSAAGIEAIVPAILGPDGLLASSWVPTLAERQFVTLLL